LILGAFPEYTHRLSVQGFTSSNLAASVSLYLCSIPHSIAKKIKVLEN
jgi:hypothetical protein